MSLTPGNPNRLSDEERNFVLRCLAEHMSGPAIIREVAKRFRRSLAKSTVSYYRNAPEHQETIREFRAQLEIAIREEVPIASKYWRMKKLQELFNRENRYRPVRYQKGVDKNGRVRMVPIYEIPLGELRALLNQAALEMGDLKEVHEVIDPTRDEYVATFDDGVEFGILSEEEEVRSPDPSDVSTETSH